MAPRLHLERWFREVPVRPILFNPDDSEMRFEESDPVDGQPASVDASAGAPTLPDDEAQPSDQEEAGSAELMAMKEKYLRLAAEYDNYRKRTDRERIESRDRAQGQIIERLLETVDDLERVTGSTPEGTTVEALLEGVQLVEKKLLRTLEGEGLELVEAKGQPFDPIVHEAIVMAPTTESAEDHTVGEVFQTGYRFRGHLLRPARVQVRTYEG